MLAAEDALLTDAPQETDISNGRFNLFRLYLREMNLTGHDHMGVELENGELAVHAHNVFLQTAFDFGVPGGGLFGLLLLLLLIGALRYFLQYRDADDGALVPLLSILGFAITGIAEWIFQFSNPYTIMLLLSVMPLIAGGSAKEQE